jgi:hypothetical protein
MTQMLRRPPAKEICWPRLAGPSNLQHYAAVDSDRGAELRRGSDTVQHPEEIAWQDLLQLQPVKEQPKLVLYSAAQPFIRTGHMRRWTRTFMSASGRFLGRWAYIGIQQRLYTERTRMTGVPMRTGLTYQVPRFKVAPRAIQLGERQT